MSSYKNIPTQNNRDYLQNNRDYSQNNKDYSQNNKDYSQNNRDYFKDLKDIKKEIEKIYKQLSKDETLTQILNNIKTDFISNNISIIEDNLSKPNITNYKEFNPKIIKMLNLFIKILKDCVIDEQKDIIFLTNLATFKDELLNETIKKDNYQHQHTYVNKFVNKMISDKLTDKFDNKKIYSNILMYYYYYELFSNSNVLDKNDSEISNTNNELKKFNNNDSSREAASKISTLKNELISLHEQNKRIYRELFNFIKLESLEIIQEILKNADEKKKSSENDYKRYVEKFKKEIYYETININNNTKVNDDYTRLKENSNERIDLESRKKLLGEMKELLYKQLSKLDDVIKYLVALNKLEYEKEIVELRKIFKKMEDKDKDNKGSIYLLSLIINEETEISSLLARNMDEKKILENSNNNRNNDRDYGRDYGRGYRQYQYGEPLNGGYKIYGGEKKNNKYYEEKYDDIKKLYFAIDSLIKSIETNEGKEDVDNPFQKNINTELSLNGNNITSIYKNIWNDYIKETKKNKAKGATIDSLKQENRLYERFRDNELDPTEVLKITFEDKVIFIGIILLLRTFSMVLIEFLIDYNVIGTIFRGIVIYSVIYILLIILSVIIINYDSYKLRIIVNYLNLHINSSNIVLHIIMFCLLIGLILIIINNNEIDSIDIDNILSYTYVYKYIYEIAEKSKYIYENPEKTTTTSYLIISEKEKMKLRYRMDIITMLIFIFSSLLILVM
jgi:hypothetical protein